MQVQKMENSTDCPLVRN